jgi:hypothetical protein
VHEGKVVVACLDDGAIRFTRPHGGSFDSPQPPAANWEDLMTHQPIRITPQTAITAWSGDELDVELAVDWLLWNAERQKYHSPIQCLE